MENNKVIEIDNRNVFCSYTKEGWTLSLLEKGGPIIIGINFNEVKREFKEALKLCEIFKRTKQNK